MRRQEYFKHTRAHCERDSERERQRECAFISIACILHTKLKRSNGIRHNVKRPLSFKTYMYLELTSSLCVYVCVCVLGLLDFIITNQLAN